MSRPTYTVRKDLVRIHLKGVPQRFPKVPKDDGLVYDFARATRDGTLPAPYRTEMVGGGEYVALFHNDDIEKVYAWLNTRADIVYEHPERPE